jgi:UDP-N-acetylglucosamine 2-epimerase
MKIITILGARPQFIKAAAVSRLLRRSMREVIIHTGQHYDRNMSKVFFDELGIPAPDYNLGIGSGPQAAQTGAMMAGIEKILVKEKPAWVLVYGDTNSTVAGALAAAKLHIPICHIEAGLRSFNRRMPEEINRIVTDHLSDLLLCPGRTAVVNLKKEGITRGVHLVGDVMADALAYAAKRSRNHSRILEKLGLAEKKYLLATVHRAENTDDPARLRNILSAFSQIEEPVIFPVHPRTRNCLAAFNSVNRKSQIDNLKFIDPLGYLDMVRMEQSARMILTDSGGIQKEAYWLGVPCVTLRNETEWVETVKAGWNVLAGADCKRILKFVRSFVPPSNRPPLYGDGHAAAKCVTLLK